MAPGVFPVVMKRNTRLINHRAFNNWIKSTLIKVSIRKLRKKHPKLE